ncbi:hypothetical protein [Flavobacterium sp.]|uniref:hypothetical protein n=1 Tax=Flavobacterium sp. TaxID=239 RepID=UPI003D0AD2A3
MEANFELIEKEQIDTLHFPANDVIDELDLRIQRKVELERAQALGNLEHTKIKIFFEDDASKKIVDTTIWGVTDVEIILKKGVVIPIHRIYKIV